MPMPFPPGFVWGTATSSYQIEGAVDEDGRGVSIWDTFSHAPGRTRNGETGDVAADHYHRWADDVDLIASYGHGAYRFSVSWARIQPSGRGSPNQRGLDFYSRLVDRLRHRGIRPMATLYHWDLPQALQDEGGWQNREIADRFADYAAVVYEGLGDGVAWWMTHNEPWCTAALGHRIGIHAPGIRGEAAEVRAAHHVLLSHGRAVEAYRASGLVAPIGIALNLTPTYPEDDTDADRRAATLSDAYTNRWYLDPILRASYPDDLRALYAQRFELDWIRDGDLARIAQPIEFLGVNYYARRVVRAPRDGEAAEYAWVVREPGPGVPLTAMGWEMTPDTFLDLLIRLHDDYAPQPIIVTENGVGLHDRLSDDGDVNDPVRIEYLRTHLGAVETAIERGVDIGGYFVWSLMDNFEWAEGYRPRFGLTYVDFPTQRRIPKDSARWYAEVVRRNGLG
jgi:beta-glucosidase